MSDVKLYTRRDMARLTALGAAGLAVKKSLAVSSSEVSSRARGMLLAAKSFYVGGRVLPSDLKECAYIGNTNAQGPFVRTGISLLYGDEIGCSVIGKGRNGGTNYFMGCSDSFVNGLELAIDYSSATQGIRGPYGSSMRESGYFLHENDETEVAMVNALGYLSVGGLRKEKVGINSFTSRECLIFTTNRGGSPFTNYSYRGKITRAYIKRNGVLVRDFVTVRSKIDGVGYFFDKVTNTRFGNAGTGAFTVGPDI